MLTSVLTLEIEVFNIIGLGQSFLLNFAKTGKWVSQFLNTEHSFMSTNA